MGGSGLKARCQTAGQSYIYMHMHMLRHPVKMVRIYCRSGEAADCVLAH